MDFDLKTVFPDFSPDLITAIHQEGVQKSIPSETILMKTGQYIKQTVLVLDGAIKVYRQDEDGGEFFMYYLQPGQACAISMICATKSEKSQIMAKAVEDSQILMLPLQLMEQWMMQHRSWYEFVIETYRSRFEEVLEVINNIAFKAMDERLEFYLKRHQKATNSNLLKLTHQEIANELNTSREVISRLLKKLEQRGFLELNRHQINII